MRGSDVIRGSTPLDLQVPTSREFRWSDVTMLWQRFWEPNSAHSIVPVMDRSSCDALFSVFISRAFSGDADLIHVDVTNRVDPEINAVIFSTIALSAQCHEYKNPSRYFELACASLDLVDKRRVFEYLLATTLLVSRFSSAFPS